MPVTVVSFGDVDVADLFGPHQLWSWALTLVGCTALILGGRRMWGGWLLGLSGQVLWVTYAVVTAQYGFVASALFYGGVYLANLLRERRLARTAAAERITPSHTLPPFEVLDDRAADLVLLRSLTELRMLTVPQPGHITRADADAARFLYEGLRAQGFRLVLTT